MRSPESRQRSSRAYREKCISEKRCEKCGTALCRESLLKRSLRCTTCRKKRTTRAKKRYAQRKSERLCRHCGQKLDQACVICVKCSAKSTALARQKRKEIQESVLDAYGRKCNCCGESEKMFLQLDHVNNDGAAHRKQVGQRMWHWAAKNEFPDSLQLLCCNCNQGKQLNGGVCPHLSQ